MLHINRRLAKTQKLIFYLCKRNDSFQFDGESNFNLWGTEMIKSKLSTGMAYVYVSNK